jgi:hypothetical protein
MIVVYETVFVKISINYFPNVTIAIYFSLFACKDSEVQCFTTVEQSAVLTAVLVLLLQTAFIKM